MTHDLRRYIDAVTLIETRHGWRLVAIDDLPKETQNDIFGWIADTNPLFDNDPTYVRDNLWNLAPPVTVWTGDMTVAQLLPTMDRKNSAIAVKNYKAMLTRGVEFDPILVTDGKFLDGGHRLQAYAEAGRTMIPVVEVGHLINASPEFWERWIDRDQTAQFKPKRPQ